MSSKGKSGYGSVWTLVLVIFFEVAVVLFLVSADYARDGTVKEGAWISEALGDGTNREIQRRADAMYEDTVIRWELTEWFHRLFIPSDAERNGSRGLETLGDFSDLGDLGSGSVFSVAESRWSAFLDMTYWTMRRIALFTIWLPVWLPAFVIAGVCGWLERAVKKTDFGYTSPVLFANSWKALICALLLLLVSFLCPMPMPPSIVPALLGFMAILVGLCLGNVQKRI